MTKDELLEKANSLPLAPGVYLMHGKDGDTAFLIASGVESGISGCGPAPSGLSKVRPNFDDITTRSLYGCKASPSKSSL